MERVKLKTCRECKRRFEPFLSTQVTCGAICALNHTRKQKMKAKKVELKARKEKLKSLSDHHRETQAIFNRFIRLRDRDKPCISCQRSTGAKRNAGHYLAVGSHPELRYDPDNCFSQCEKCNSWLSGNQQAYRASLLELIGSRRLGRLEGPHKPKQYRVEDLKAIQADYKARIKALNATQA
jgi:hypothetical protein